MTFQTWKQPFLGFKAGSLPILQGVWLGRWCCPHNHCAPARLWCFGPCWNFGAGWGALVLFRLSPTKIYQAYHSLLLVSIYTACISSRSPTNSITLLPLISIWKIIFVTLICYSMSMFDDVPVSLWLSCLKTKFAEIWRVSTTASFSSSTDERVMMYCIILYRQKKSEMFVILDCWADTYTENIQNSSQKIGLTKLLGPASFS